MNDRADITAEQLKQTCKLTSCRWAVWMRRAGTEWQFGSHYALNKTRQAALERFIQQPEAATWLAGALSSGRTRSRNCGDLTAQLGCERAYLFVNPQTQSAILAGADQLHAEAQTFFRILALGKPTDPASLEILAMDQLISPLEEVGPDASYNPQVVLAWLLENLGGLVRCNGINIAFHAGDLIHVQAVSGSYQAVARGLEIAILDDPVLVEVVSSREGLVLSEFTTPPHSAISTALPKPVRSCMILPVNYGRRVIGIVTFVSFRPHAFSSAELQNTQRHLDRVAYAVENTIVFTDMSGYLQQFALINELSSAAAIGVDISEVARNIVARLRRRFHTNVAAVLLLSPDRRMLREYGGEPGAPPLLVPVNSSLVGYTVETGQPVRVGDIRHAPRFKPELREILSVLAVPLKYRGRVFGAISVESMEANAFSSQDEQLLVVTASHLAGLVENARLHEETRERAQNLDLIHRVVQRVVGLTGELQIAQETAELMADYFNYEFAVVILLDETGQNLTLTGVGGTMSHLVHAGYSYPVTAGITGRAVRTGESFYSNNISLESDYISLSGWLAGSEMCVPLREGDRVFGVINLERAQQQAFTDNDLLLVESLAGILSSVMMNAHRHQELKVRVSHLNAVRETALDISGDLDLDTLLQRVNDRILEMMHCSDMIIGLIDEKEQVVRIIAPVSRWYGENSVVPFMSGVIGRVAASGETLVVPDYRAWSGRLRTPLVENFTTIAGAPLKWMGQVIGILVIADDQPGRVFKDEEVQLLELLAPQVAISIRNAQLYQELGERIEAQRQAENQLLRSARLAALGEMAAGVAHELNNPLTTVAGFVELVLDELPKDLPQREELELVIAEAQRARTVVRRMLDFARQSENVRAVVDFNELVSETLNLIQHQIQTTGVLIQTRLGDELPAVFADPNQLKQVLLNLVQNALQAMPHGGELKVETHRLSRAGVDGVTVAICDNGEGIPAENIDRVFEPFFTTRPVGKGTGLGLSVIYGIITEHGGRIDVESQPGRGSCFTVWLPVELGERHG